MLAKLIDIVTGLPSLVTRAETYAAILVAAGVGWFGWLYTHDKKVERKVQMEISRKTDALTSKSIQAQRSVATDGAASRMRRDYCPGC